MTVRRFWNVHPWKAVFGMRVGLVSMAILVSVAV
jgi:hypothetical protein